MKTVDTPLRSNWSKFQLKRFSSKFCASSYFEILRNNCLGDNFGPILAETPLNMHIWHFFGTFKLIRVTHKNLINPLKGKKWSKIAMLPLFWVYFSNKYLGKYLLGQKVKKSWLVHFFIQFGQIINI